MRTLIVAVTASIIAPAAAQPADYDFDFVTITNPGNPSFTARPDRLGTHERGSVGYEYRIARSEISTSQWMEFVNSIGLRSMSFATAFRPTNWGGSVGPPAPDGSFQWQLNPNLPDAGNVPVGGITFTEAAVYANWLHNGKRNDDASLMSGAYEIDVITSTGAVGMTNFERLPGARYWVPTLDEWMKAVYWDPANPDRDGWWLQPGGSDDVLPAGPPGVGQTNRGMGSSFTWEEEFRINEYPDTQTPWGLLDASGGASEWTSSLDALSMADGRLWVPGLQ